MKRDLAKRPERVEAAQHNSRRPYFVSIPMDEGRIGTARAVRSLIPVVIMPVAAECSVPQPPALTWPHLCEPDSARQDDFAEGQTG